MTPLILLIITAIILMSALILSALFIIYLVKLFTYRLNTNLGRPIYRNIDAYWLASMWALFYALNHLIK